MNLPKERWYSKLFFASTEIVDAFVHRGYYAWRFEKGTDICHFMRTIFVYAPAVLLLHLLVALEILAATIVVPLCYLGVGGYSIAILYTGILAGIMCGLYKLTSSVVAGIGSLGNKIEEKRRSRQGPSFWKLTGEWLYAQKRKVCPLINFVSNEENDNV